MEDQPQSHRLRNPHRLALLCRPRRHPPHYPGRRPLLWAMTMEANGVLSPLILVSILAYFDKAR